MTDGSQIISPIIDIVAYIGIDQIVIIYFLYKFKTYLQHIAEAMENYVDIQTNRNQILVQTHLNGLASWAAFLLFCLVVSQPINTQPIQQKSTKNFNASTKKQVPFIIQSDTATYYIPIIRTDTTIKRYPQGSIGDVYTKLKVYFNK